MDSPPLEMVESPTPPGGPVTVTPEELKLFTIKEDVPPPGGPVEGTETGPGASEGTTPADPGTASPEESEKFRIRRNLPAPGVGP